MIEDELGQTQRNPHITQDQQRIKGVILRVQLREPYALVVLRTDEHEHQYVRIPTPLARDLHKGQIVQMHAKQCSAALWDATTLQVLSPPDKDTTQPLPANELALNENAELLTDPHLRDTLGHLTNALYRVNSFPPQSELDVARRKLANQCLIYIRLMLTAADSLVLDGNEIALKNLVNEVRRLTK